MQIFPSALNVIEALHIVKLPLNPPRKGGLKKAIKVSPAGGDLEGAKIIIQTIPYFLYFCG